VLGGLFWKLWGKTVTLWYAHKSVTWGLRLASYISDIIFTSTKSGYRLSNSKSKVIGQGIDTNKFKVESLKLKDEGGVFKIVTVGRITPSKDYDTLINAVEILKKNSAFKISVDIVGPTPFISDESYLKSLQEKIVQKGLVGVINFLGPVANMKLPNTLSDYDLFVNMGHTGSLDKAVPEAMASGLPVLTCNEAFKDVLGPFTEDLMYKKGDSRALAEKIKRVMEFSESERLVLGESLRSIVVQNHSLATFVGKIISAIEIVRADFRK
jgi:glycosyltransferase involved in cell wall biosynthesis